MVKAEYGTTLNKLMQLVQRTIVFVVRIITHDKFHLDELLAVFIHERFGAQKFRVKEDRRRFGYQNTWFWAEGGSRTPDGRSFEEYILAGGLPVGVGGPFCEHAFNGAASDVDDCASDRYAKFLGVQDHKSLMAMLDITKINDTKGGGYPLDMAQVLKSMHRKYNNQTVMDWGMFALNARFDANELEVKGELKSPSGNFFLNFGRFMPLDEALGLWLKGSAPIPPVNNGEAFTDAVLRSFNALDNERYGKFVNHVTRGSQRNELHLSRLLMAMAQQGYPWEQVRPWAFDAFDAVLADFKEHQEANRDVARIAEKRTVLVKGNSLNLWIIRSNNRRMGAAARSKGADIVIQRDAEDHTFIFTNKRTMEKIFSAGEIHELLTSIVFELRINELAAMHISDVNDHPLDQPDPEGAHKILRCEGGVSIVPQCFYHRALGAILFGSESSSNNTCLSTLECVVEAVVKGAAMYDGAVKERESVRKDTFEFRGVPLSLWVLSAGMKMSVEDAFKRGADLVVRESGKHKSLYFQKGCASSVIADDEMQTELLGCLIRQLRRKELKAKGVAFHNPVVLSSPGRVKIVPEWTFRPGQLAMINESDDAATQLPTEEIVEMVKQRFRALDFIEPLTSASKQQPNQAAAQHRFK